MHNKKEKKVAELITMTDKEIMTTITMRGCKGIKIMVIEIMKTMVDK